MEVFIKENSVRRQIKPMTRAGRREQLLEVARSIVAHGGVGALTMSALCERAGVARPVVYSHFANRNQVAIALLNEHFQSMENFVRERVAEARTLREYLSLVIEGSIDFEMQSTTRVRNITNGFSAEDEVNEAFRRHWTEYRRQLRVLLQMQGIGADVGEVAARGLMGMLNELVIGYAELRPGKKTRETIKTMVIEAIEALIPLQKRNREFHALMNFDLSSRKRRRSVKRRAKRGA
jgi:AcrR family transcriptional regulator